MRIILSNTCKNCGSKFTPKYTLDYYCSDECHIYHIESLRREISEDNSFEGNENNN